jgi:hypothetical protein
MKIYMAGLFCNNLGSYPNFSGPRECWRDYRYPAHLESFHYINKTPAGPERIREYGAKVFLDSGAFSAFTLGANIDREDYANFILDHQDIIECASVLDAIGDPIETLKNQEWFDRNDVPVLPCFHFGEPVEYLEHYVANYPRITLGGMVPIDKMVLRDWLDHLFKNYLCDDKGKPLVKVHGFGMTTWDLMFRYPWDSVDSTSYISGSKLGSIFMMINGKQTMVQISEGGEKDLGSYASLAPILKDTIDAELNRLCYSVADLRSNYALRDRFNCEFFDRAQALGISVFKPDLIMEGLF